jgi:hypothetical protein
MLKYLFESIDEGIDMAEATEDEKVKLRSAKRRLENERSLKELRREQELDLEQQLLRED